MPNVQPNQEVARRKRFFSKDVDSYVLVVLTTVLDEPTIIIEHIQNRLSKEITETFSTHDAQSYQYCISKINSDDAFTQEEKERMASHIEQLAKRASIF